MANFVKVCKAGEVKAGCGKSLEINGKAAGGKPVQITIDCPAFAGIEAEGG